ncbi:ABC transporter permease [Nonomuraea sp. KC401]|uniref:ABC transporter permease n=1 Tax=unclassified Nonomuraea TaxID=2593643 RepID=UPI0010FD5040|nr:MULTISPECIES: ABC transporter permease [unclassified Nonomuraea]NBE92638.1 ABC transporter permease subunit [Nonomuraea sp. K271]TLF84589.1 ABC transporter permease [Nonomuraea sp. KC401]
MSAKTRSARLTVLGLTVPGLLGLAVSFVLPLAWLLRMSFNRGDSTGYIEETFTLDSYAQFVGDSYYWDMAWETTLLGLGVTVLTIVVSYPIALFLVRTESRFKGILVALAVAPLLTSSVVRTYGWLVLLGNQGVVNEALMGAGLVDQPLALINNRIGVYIALVEIMMPYMILCLLAGFGRFNPELEHAAQSLGANRWRTFWRIVWPLSMPGVLTGALLVFVLTISSFVTPRLVGGGKVFYLATEIYDQATATLNWPFAAAIAFILLALFAVVIVIYQRALRRIEAQ